MAGSDRLPEDVQDNYMVLVFLSWSLPILISDVYLTICDGKTSTVKETEMKREKVH